MLAILLLFKSSDWPAWNEIALRYIEYLGYFLIYGVLGFQWLVHRCRSDISRSPTDGVLAVYQTALYRASRMGIIGAIALATELVLTGALRESASRKASFLAAAGPKILIQLGFAVLALLAFLAVARGVSRAWAIAWIAGGGFLIRNFSNHKWTGPLNPLHEAGAALWLGTLLTIVVVGLPAVLRSDLDHLHRSRVIPHLIQRFAGIALTGASLMVVSGILTSWTHLHRWTALWTTSYGLTLCIKLCLVLVVVGLGALNWRRIGPSLQTAPNASTIRRTSTAELVFAGLVLAVTAVLVLLPSPHGPKG